jgi:hypothetical protein
MRTVLLRDYLPVCVAINELDLIDIVGKGLRAQTSSVAACSKGSTDIYLDHNDIGFVLVAVLDAPPAQLIVAYSCPNLNQVLPHLLFLLDRVDFSHFPD